MTYHAFGLTTTQFQEYAIFLVMLVLGFAISFAMYHNFRLRVPGVIATPLLAVYTLDNFWTLALVAALAIVVFFILRMFYLRYFLYGRRLFLLGASWFR